MLSSGSFGWRGGLQTSGRHLDWNAVIALATSVAAIAAIGALTAVAFGVEQLRAARRNERLAMMPYLRVDVGFIPDSTTPGSMPHQGSFRPPKTPRLFTAADFGPNLYSEALRPLQPAPGQPPLDIRLGTNKQTAPLGGAFQIRIGLYVAWGEEPPNIAEVAVSFAYVEPEKTTAIHIATIRADLPELTVSVFAASYYGMYLDRELRNRHGALNLYYDPKRGVMENDRFTDSEKPLEPDQKLLWLKGGGAEIKSEPSRR